MTTVESFIRGNRVATITSDGAVLTLSCYENGVEVGGQCFTANPASLGPERCTQAAQKWTREAL